MSKKHRREPNDQPEATGPAPEDVPSSEPGAPDEAPQMDRETADEQAPVVDEQQATVEALAQERDELFAQLQRVSADYQNFIRRSQQNTADSIGVAKGDLLRSLIPVLDHFDHALSSKPESEDGQRLYDGVRIVRDELMKVLEQAGVKRIDVQPGDPFDPHLHEAMMRQPAEGVEPNHVSATLQPGYVFGERTLRAAKVAVAPEE
jgi:molecular chaperone GrpE